MPSEKYYFRLFDKEPLELEVYLKNTVGDTTSEKLRQLVLNHIRSKAEGERALDEPLSFQEPDLECEFAAWIKEKNLVRCTCSYPSVKKWQPRNRLVFVSECERCNLKDAKGTRFGVDQWLTKLEIDKMDKGTFCKGVKFPFRCLLKDKGYSTENDFTDKFCGDCKNKCPMKRTSY